MAQLLDVAKSLRPHGFCLWVFESNAPARQLLRAARAASELERTDGSANEERSPDLKLAWPGADPIAFFRGLIDEVDADLGDLLARRAALTAAVQPAQGRPRARPGPRHAIAPAIAESPTWRPSLTPEPQLKHRQSTATTRSASAAIRCEARSVAPAAASRAAARGAPRARAERRVGVPCHHGASGSRRLAAFPQKVARHPRRGRCCMLDLDPEEPRPHARQVPVTASSTCTSTPSTPCSTVPPGSPS